ncbi:39S ribosomal protein L38, mitochondrial [Harmonia axyridis]|uniref:39S ribosomal protein L38, mitochondrial n=1 Tax=Harmonia axyridis TaxID=115357 RepID=UPI001E274E4D|nr:39S ribosomal protein L38, mitochondrial [Harmonia axyridis]
MSLSSLKYFRFHNFLLKSSTIGLEFGPVRYGHHMRGKPPGIARSIDQRLEEYNYKDPELNKRIDIGFPLNKIDGKTKQEQVEFLKKVRSNANMEKESRNRRLMIDLDEAYKEWSVTIAPQHLKRIADHYGIFEHLYGYAYFYPKVALDVTFSSDDVLYPVYFGNTIKPEDAKKKPIVKYSCEKDTLWTLLLTNLDGHFTDNDKEYVHWFIGNIPESNIEKGETIFEYLQPFPPKGTGYHRFAVVLYKQDKKIDFSQLKPDNVSNYDLQARTFSTLEFYRSHQDYMTPAGLAFFQSHWDKSLKEFYHEKLGMKEPIFEYDFNPAYIKPQAWFPLRQPFNLYMDKYRDPQQINKEFLQRKLKNVHPFKAPPKPIPFPNAEPWSKPYVPSWLKLEITKSRLKWGRINDIE